MLSASPFLHHRRYRVYRPKKEVRYLMLSRHTQNEIALVLINETRVTALWLPLQAFLLFSHFTLYETKKSQSIVFSHRKSQMFCPIFLVNSSTLCRVLLLPNRNLSCNGLRSPATIETEYIFYVIRHTLLDCQAVQSPV